MRSGSPTPSTEPSRGSTPASESCRRRIRPEPRSVGRVAELLAFGSLWVGSQDDAVSRIDPHRSVLGGDPRRRVADRSRRHVDIDLGDRGDRTDSLGTEPAYEPDRSADPTARSPNRDRYGRRRALGADSLPAATVAHRSGLEARQCLDGCHSRFVRACHRRRPRVGGRRRSRDADRVRSAHGSAVRTKQIIRPLGSVAGDAGLLWLTAP